MANYTKNFSGQPLNIVCVYDPRENYYVVEFTQFGTPSAQSVLSIVEAFQILMVRDGKFDQFELGLRRLTWVISVCSSVIINLDQKCSASLLDEVKKINSTPEQLLANILRKSSVTVNLS